jgi:hypothetical protein
VVVPCCSAFDNADCPDAVAGAAPPAEDEDAGVEGVAPKEKDDAGQYCFNCGKTGHTLWHCPEPKENGNQPLLLYCCFLLLFVLAFYHHFYFYFFIVAGPAILPFLLPGGFKFAKCFICKEQGHLSGTCTSHRTRTTAHAPPHTHHRTRTTAHARHYSQG